MTDGLGYSQVVKPDLDTERGGWGPNRQRWYNSANCTGGTSNSTALVPLRTEKGSARCDNRAIFRVTRIHVNLCSAPALGRVQSTLGFTSQMIGYEAGG